MGGDRGQILGCFRGTEIIDPIFPGGYSNQTHLI
jgi:hypothetical protein